MIGAGDLRERIEVEERLTGPTDEFGNPQTVWQLGGTFWAHYRVLRGGETVQAARLEGRQVLVVTVRATALTRRIRPDWRLRDARDGRVFEITAPIVLTDDRSMVEITCEDRGEGMELGAFDPGAVVVVGA